MQMVWTDVYFEWNDELPTVHINLCLVQMLLGLLFFLQCVKWGFSITFYIKFKKCELKCACNSAEGRPQTKKKKKKRTPAEKIAILICVH